MKLKGKSLLIISCIFCLSLWGLSRWKDHQHENALADGGNREIKSLQEEFDKQKGHSFVIHGWKYLVIEQGQLVRIRKLRADEKGYE